MAEDTLSAPVANRFDRMEVAGAFGDLGTLVPFVVAYVGVLKIDPIGVLFAFGLSMIICGLVYRTCWSRAVWGTYRRRSSDTWVRAACDSHPVQRFTQHPVASVPSCHTRRNPVFAWRPTGAWRLRCAQGQGRALRVDGHGGAGNLECGHRTCGWRGGLLAQQEGFPSRLDGALPCSTEPSLSVNATAERPRINYVEPCARTSSPTGPRCALRYIPEPPLPLPPPAPFSLPDAAQGEGAPAFHIALSVGSLVIDLPA